MADSSTSKPDAGAQPQQQPELTLPPMRIEVPLMNAPDVLGLPPPPTPDQAPLQIPETTVVGTTNPTERLKQDQADVAPRDQSPDPDANNPYQRLTKALASGKVSAEEYDAVKKRTPDEIEKALQRSEIRYNQNKPQAAVQTAGQPAPEAAPAEPPPVAQKTAPQGGSAAPATDASAMYASRVEGDYGKEIEAGHEEQRARTGYAEGVGDAMGDEAETLRNGAKASETQAADTYAQGNDAIAEIHQLTQDYANQHIDPNQWWSEKTVPQQIGSVVAAAMFGFAGGPEAAQNYVNGMIDRNIRLQQEAIERKGHVVGQMVNLLDHMQHNSASYQEAMDKTRAAMFQAAGIEVQRAATKFTAPIEVAKINELLAAMQTQRDMALASLHAAARGGAAGAGQDGLEVDPKTLVTDPDNGATYMTADPAYSDDLKNIIGAYARIQQAVKDGTALLDQRTAIDYLNPIGSDNLRRGEAIDAIVQESVAKLAASRGVPPAIKEMVSKLLPQYGTRGAALDRGKADTVVHLLTDSKGAVLEAAGAIPAYITWGQGKGKNANKWVPYAKLGEGARAPVQGPQGPQPQKQTPTPPKHLDFVPSKP